MRDNSDNFPQDERRRFQKPRWAIDMAQEDPYGCIVEVFSWIHLKDFRDELEEWVRIALINDHSAYDTGAAREDVMDFCDELQLLTEALQVVNANREPDSFRRWKEKLSDDCRQEIESYHQPVLLTEAQKANPLLVIIRFCKKFTLSYAKGELWDLLDAVINYERKRSTWMPAPHVTHKCLLALVEAAYVLYQLRT